MLPRHRRRHSTLRLATVPVIAATACLAMTGAAIAAKSTGSGLPGPTRHHGTAGRLSPTGRFDNGVLAMDGRLLTPAGATTRVGDFPEGVAVSPGRRFIAVSNAGQGEGAPGQGNESLQLVSAATGKVLDTRTDHAPGKDTFYNGGLAWAPGGHVLYAVGGGNDAVYKYKRLTDNTLKLVATWTSTQAAGAPGVGTGGGNGVPGSASTGDVTGYSRDITLTPDAKTLVVTNEQGGSVAAIATSTGAIEWQTQLGNAQQQGGTYPNGVAVSPDGATAYVAAQGANALYSLSTSTGAIVGVTPVGDHPVDVVVTPSGKQALVSDANDDSIAVIDLTAAPPTVSRLVSVHLFRHEANGSSPVSVAYDPTRHRLYSADAGDNAVAVLTGKPAGTDLVARSIHVAGQLPTDFYPDAVALGAHGRVVVASAKGAGGVPVTNRQQYDGNDMVGTLSRVAAPSQRTLRRLTRRALADEFYLYRREEAHRPTASPIPTWANAGHSPIKHVVLVVRENRTFDQEFGDLRSHGYPHARVHPAFTEFGLRDAKGRTVTPNAHAIASRYGISDNFFSDGEASIQGHHLTAEGVSTYYTETSWTQNYSNRNHPYDPVFPIVYPRCGALFQQAAAHGARFRNFGELVGMSTAQTPTTTTAPGARCATQGGSYDPVVAANTSATYPNNLTLTSVKDTDRLKDFEQEYAPLVAADKVPAFSYLLMGNDHTDGTTAGDPTPQALVATNDQAVGGLIDYLSHTPQWKSTAVFVEEDDSQDGLDHVDGHRNILLVASPFARRHHLSHVHISQASVTAMIDRILGLPASASYEQYAPIPYDLFTAKASNAGPYKHRTPTYPQDATNPSAQSGTPAAIPVDTSGVDLAGPVLEAQLWQATHPGQPLPQQLVDEVVARGGVRPAAARAWARGLRYSANPLRAGLTTAVGYGDSDG